VESSFVFRHGCRGSEVKQRKEVDFTVCFGEQWRTGLEGRALEGNKAQESNGRKSGGNVWWKQRTYLRSKASRLMRTVSAMESGANDEEARALVTGCGCKEGECFRGCDWRCGECIVESFGKKFSEVDKTQRTLNR